MKLPKLRRNPDGRAFVEHRGRRTYLGRFGTPDAERKYRRIIASIVAERSGEPAPHEPGEPLSVAMLVDAYLHFAETYYRHQPGQTTEFVGVRAAMAPLLLFGDDDVLDFGPNRLRQIQQHLAATGYARQTVNAKVSRILRCFRWAESREMVPAGTAAHLRTVDGLRQGRSAAVELPPVVGVPWSIVAATLPWLTPVVAAMVTVQYWAGMRPGEVIQMRPGDVDRSGEPWWYCPATHKTAHTGRTLVKALPAPARAALEPYLSRDSATYCFSPRESWAWSATQSRRDSRPVRPRKAIGERYSTASYGGAVRRAILKQRAHTADPQAHLPHWHPHQLRHGITTEISQRFGQQAAQRWLGHARLDTTAIYDELTRTELATIAAKVDVIHREAARPTP